MNGDQGQGGGSELEAVTQEYLAYSMDALGMAATATGIILVAAFATVFAGAPTWGQWFVLGASGCGPILLVVEIERFRHAVADATGIAAALPAPGPLLEPSRLLLIAVVLGGIANEFHLLRAASLEHRSSMVFAVAVAFTVLMFSAISGYALSRLGRKSWRVVALLVLAMAARVGAGMGYERVVAAVLGPVGGLLFVRGLRDLRRFEPLLRRFRAAWRGAQARAGTAEARGRELAKNARDLSGLQSAGIGPDAIYLGLWMLAAFAASWWVVPEWGTLLAVLGMVPGVIVARRSRVRLERHGRLTAAAHWTPRAASIGRYLALVVVGTMSAFYGWLWIARPAALGACAGSVRYLGAALLLAYPLMVWRLRIGGIGIIWIFSLMTYGGRVLGPRGFLAPYGRSQDVVMWLAGAVYLIGFGLLAGRRLRRIEGRLPAPAEPND
jgi:hypothetical protein